LIQERERAVVGTLARHGYLPLAGKRVLDVGCGTGDWLREFIRWGARPEDLTGIDLLPNRVADARHLCPPGVRLECGSATELPFEAGTFDLVLQATLFSSVLDAGVKGRIATEPYAPELVTDLDLTRPGRHVVLTFDDGGRSALAIGDTLAARGWRGHFFIVTGLIGSRAFLAPQQIRYLRGCGHVIGSHSE